MVKTLQCFMETDEICKRHQTKQNPWLVSFSLYDCRKLYNVSRSAIIILQHFFVTFATKSISNVECV